MRTLIVTIVTRGDAWEDLDNDVQHDLTRWLGRFDPASAEYEQAYRLVKERTGLSPATGQVAAIGIWDQERESGVMYMTLPVDGLQSLSADWQLRTGDEAAMLSWFWRGVSGYQILVTFAGNSFMFPFLVHRAIRHGVTPVRQLLGTRRLPEQQLPYHVDLQAELTGYSAMRKRPSLLLWCRTYDISIPKLRAELQDIEHWYSVGDVSALTEHIAAKAEATNILYKRWCAHMAPPGWATGSFFEADNGVVL